MADSDDPAVALAADPQALKELRRRCRADREAVGGELCEAAARATRMRFMNDGATAYAPGVVSGETGGADADNGQAR